MENFLASKAHTLYMYMYEPSVARLRNFLGIPLKQFFAGMGISSFSFGMFVDQTIFSQQSVGQTIFFQLHAKQTFLSQKKT